MTSKDLEVLDKMLEDLIDRKFSHWNANNIVQNPKGKYYTTFRINPAIPPVQEISDGSFILNKVPMSDVIEEVLAPRKPLVMSSLITMTHVLSFLRDGHGQQLFDVYFENFLKTAEISFKNQLKYGSEETTTGLCYLMVYKTGDSHFLLNNMSDSLEFRLYSDCVRMYDRVGYNIEKALNGEI